GDGDTLFGGRLRHGPQPPDHVGAVSGDSGRGHPAHRRTLRPCSVRRVACAVPARRRVRHRPHPHPPAGPPEGRPVKRELLLAAAAFAFLAPMLALAAAALIFLAKAVVDLAHARGLAYTAAALSVIAGGMAVSYGVDRAPWPWARTARTVLDVLFVAAGSLGVV